MNTYDSLLLIRRGSNWELYHNGLPFGTIANGAFAAHNHRLPSGDLVPVKLPTELMAAATWELLELIPVDPLPVAVEGAANKMLEPVPIEGLLQYTTKHDK